ncbi:MAG: DinB family protein [Acidobacteria bacterium]|nr:DinB family protein [Acidobacteriota bacterium]
MIKNSVGSTDLPGLVGQLGPIAEEARAAFGGLSAGQLNWKPSPVQWSVAQCFDHLIVTNEFYFPLLEKIRNGERKSGLWERLTPLSGFFGWVVIKSVESEKGLKVKAPAKLLPSSSGTDERVIERFVEHQGELAKRISATKDLDLSGIVVTSPISGFVTFNLLDAYRIVVAHERRHFEQARRVKESDAFPRA